MVLTTGSTWPGVVNAAKARARASRYLGDRKALRAAVVYWVWEAVGPVKVRAATSCVRCPSRVLDRELKSRRSVRNVSVGVKRSSDTYNEP